MLGHAWIASSNKLIRLVGIERVDTTRLRGADGCAGLLLCS